MIYLKRKPNNRVIDSRFETENFSTLGDVNSILLKVVLLHSWGCGSLYETATPTFMTSFRNSVHGLSNEVSFVSESSVCLLMITLNIKICKKVVNKFTLPKVLLIQIVNLMSDSEKILGLYWKFTSFKKWVTFSGPERVIQWPFMR